MVQPRVRPVAVAAGNRHTLVLYASGTILSCGAGDRAQLGLGHKGAALNDQNKPQKVPLEAKVACVAAGHDYSLCADEGGALYSWGWSEYGKLGTGTDGGAPLTSDASDSRGAAPERRRFMKGGGRGPARARRCRPRRCVPSVSRRCCPPPRLVAIGGAWPARTRRDPPILLCPEVAGLPSPGVTGLMLLCCTPRLNIQCTMPVR